MLHLIGWESLDKPRFSLHVMLTAVIEVQFPKSPRFGPTGLIHTGPQHRCGHQRPALAELHVMGGFMGKNNPDITGLIRRFLPHINRA